MSAKAFSYLVLSLLIFISSSLSAQQVQKTVPQVRVYMSGKSEEFGKFGYAAIERFEGILKERNLLSPKDNEYATDMALKIVEIDDKKVAVSVIILDPVPQKAVELAANAQLLYSQLSEEKKAQLPVEGKEIREYASAEYMKQFRMLLNDYLEVINKDEIDSFFRKILMEYSGE